MKRALFFLLAVAGCAPIPPPDVLAKIDAVRAAPAATLAKKHAPAAYAHADQLRLEAHRAFEDEDDFAGAQILGEQALAAYAEAAALGRAVKAEAARVQATADGDAAERRLAELDLQHQEVAADIAALEKRLEVVRETERPKSAGNPQGPEHELARRQATATLALSARLLCTSARLLLKSQPDAKAPAELDEASAALTQLDQLLASDPKAAPIDHATRARAGCLRALTLVRRGSTSASKATGSGDAFLADLSKAGIGDPQRDDRGVVVTLRDLFAGDALAPTAGKTLDALAELCRKHPGFPVLVVLHQTTAPDDAAAKRWRRLGELLVAALRERLGAERVGDAEVAGVAAPLVDPRGKLKARNERVELTFVTPQAL